MGGDAIPRPSGLSIVRRTRSERRQRQPGQLPLNGARLCYLALIMNRTCNRSWAGTDRCGRHPWMLRGRDARGLVLSAVLAAACSGTPNPATPLPPDLDPAGPYRRGATAPQALTEVAAAQVGGRIFLLGGLSAAGPTRRVDVLDPIANVWTAGPELPADAPTHHLAVAVFREQIFVLGGYLDLSFAASPKTFRLDPVSSSWVRLRDQPMARGAATAQTLRDRLYVVGGATPSQATSTLLSYDPQTDTWRTDAAMPLASEHLASCVDGARMLVVGGRASGNLRAAQRYDADQNRWTAVADLPTARGGLAAATVGRRCFVVGGEALDRPPPNTFGENEAFDWDVGTWAAQPALPTPRHGLAVVGLGPSLYTLAGGPEAGLTLSNIVEIFTPSSL